MDPKYVFNLNEQTLQGETDLLPAGPCSIPAV